MREIVWDTETTGFDPDSGDRIVEIAAIELASHIPTDKIFHRYINPQREVPQSAFDVHGLSLDFLKDHPLFAEIAPEFLAFVDGATLIAHNAEFDMKFINAELKSAGLEQLSEAQSFDTLALARKKFPGQSNSLDSLCRRFEIDNSMREKHGALLDCELLAEVYLQLIGGRQPGLVLAGAQADTALSQGGDTAPTYPARPRALSPRIGDDEQVAHNNFIAKELGDSPIWNKYPS